MKNYRYLLLLISVFVACNQPTKQSNVFKKPIILQNTPNDSAVLLSRYALQGMVPLILNNSKRTDTLRIIQDEYGDNVVDNAPKLELENDTPFRKSPISDTLTSGFEVIPDYSVNIANGLYVNFPVYIANQTHSQKKIFGKDSHVFALQEAIDMSGNWRPIEMRAFDFCGNGSWIATVNSKEYMIVLFPKYKGDYQTKLRIRFKNGNTIYVSAPFDGMIHKEQFYVQRTGREYLFVSQDKESLIEQWFYGARPLEIDDKKFGSHVINNRLRK